MRFGPVPLSLARGAILVHSVRAGSRLLRKGRVLSGDDVSDLGRAGLSEITVARPDAGDIVEDEAAARIGKISGGIAVRAGAPFTGRVNLYAETAGLACIDAGKIAAINQIDESITLATLAPFSRVRPGQMLATIKIIPFAAPKSAVEAAERIGDAGPFVFVAPLVAKRVALISTKLANTMEQVLDKGARAIDTRLVSLGSTLVLEQRVTHDEEAVCGAIAEALAADADLVLVFGASALAARSSDSACRSIRGICFSWAKCVGPPSSAFPAARARPSATASISCLSVCLPTCRCVRRTSPQWAWADCSWKFPRARSCATRLLPKCRAPPSSPPSCSPQGLPRAWEITS
jgi:molybdopterin biosynthesis enzyme